MPIPYLLAAGLYLLMALLAAVDSSATSLNLLPWFNGLRWLRVHFITLGVLVQVVFGVLPGLVAASAGRPGPKIRWDIWLALNLGLLVLLIGIPLVNAPLILTGGTLILTAAVLLARQLDGLSPERPAGAANMGRPFYLAGLGYLFFGIVFGTGLWLGWGELLRAAVPREIHLHANLWGFSSLTFAGLLVDLYPGVTGRALAWPRSIRVVLWMLVLAGALLIVGPWLGQNMITMPGLLLHHAATAILLLNVVKPLLGDRQAWSAGMVHLVAAYLWILAPLLAVPVALLGRVQVPVANVEAIGPSLLVYGWVLQLAYALVPLLFRRVLLPDAPARLGGNWLSLLAVHVGGLLFVGSIVFEPYQASLQGIAFAFWAISMLPIAVDLWRTARAGFPRAAALARDLP